MRSLLAVILVLACAVAVLSRQFVIAVILAPLAWVAASRAAREPGDMEGLMGVCLMICAATATIDLALALWRGAS